ncbi:MAG: hypothetical protein A3B66_07255 [Alphaproteobacteria bacterium RIFCSPHIGHO2_02_FULL_46_13]|nr:MAG: hypothetical protein A3B66_07255 [Alphaproteobacteria bacterium RIFCSPHIGHO2_02_FULL_46_13]
MNKELQPSVEVRRIETSAELKNVLESGLNDLYQRVFAAPPYNEKFTTDEVIDIFLSYFESGGIIFVAKDDTDKPVAFVTAVPLKSEFNVAALVSKNVDINCSSYFAEDGVAENLRKNGISARMKAILLSACQQEGYESLILRTSVYNYKQISAVNKAGGVVIAGLFQNVSSPRADGTMTQDTRSFYKFDLDANTASNKTVLERVTIVRPGGNDTAIVWDDIPREEQGTLSKRIQSTYPGIEQVMFVERGQNGLVRGQMAGGEFCGNATRSLGYLVREGRDGQAFLEISGASQPMSVVVESGMAQTSLPVKEDLNSAQPSGDDYIVHLDGISFIITAKDSVLGATILSQQDTEQQKAMALNALREKGLSDRYPASGVMIIDRQSENSFKVEPFVYVRDTGTLYYETGCGSGSTSIGIMVAKESGSSVKNLKITQPSGMDLLVSINRDEEKFESATVNGPIEILFDGRMHIASPEVALTTAAPQAAIA